MVYEYTCTIFLKGGKINEYTLKLFYILFNYRIFNIFFAKISSSEQSENTKMNLFRLN